MNTKPLVLSLALLGAAALATGCAATGSGTAPAEQPVLTMSCERPMPIADFVKWAQQVTGRIYVYDRRVVTDAEISWVGDVKCTKGEVEQFVQTMLLVKGFAVQPRQQGEIEVLEIVPAERG
ncbi:MAG: hypothetical protein KAI24_15450 [Planctomycetes bacterium]|nr:hypothetical protein [Planctomycetota bacterium]